MDYETITYALTDDVALITLNRADKMNALTTQMRAELTHAVTEGGRAARVVVLTGAGRAFCSGQDLADRLPSADHCRRERPGGRGRGEYRAGRRCRLCERERLFHAGFHPHWPDRAYFMQAFTRIGLIPDAGGTYALPRQMGMAKAMGAALFADKITARQADDWGMIWQAVPDAEFDAHWRAKAAQLAAGPTAAYAEAKKAIRASWDNGLEDQLSLEAEAQGRCGKSQDFAEGVTAFTQKRSPKFQGR